MSNIYHLEPPTKGKVVIHTNYGDIDIELWAKEVTLTVADAFCVDQSPMTAADSPAHHSLLWADPHDLPKFCSAGAGGVLR
jgi:hypothetical protein